MKKQNSLEWLEPLKNRPNLYMDEQDNLKIERVLKNNSLKPSKPFYIPALLVTVVAALVIAFNFLPLVFDKEKGAPSSAEEKSSLSTELLEDLSAFEEIDKPIFHAAYLPFERANIVSDQLPGPYWKYVDVRYSSPKQEIISLQVYFFEADADLNYDFSERAVEYKTKQGKNITYEKKANGYSVVWNESENIQLLLLVSNRDYPVEEIGKIVDSVKRYE
ncbi:hypothetical protein JOC95_003506 [Bacillus tianshenii]|uniref:DUF4367 domain-containing protein n=1 Tax=Sutcliffiella tianshenii TaxID=1463404 RepID=A0ABS2P4Q8_9BACI|nr:hypothetical protein [Bacillus tianshenii]MBM7621617.1 hypothetical protein [Bacillus tianshenii]